MTPSVAKVEARRVRVMCASARGVRGVVEVRRMSVAYIVRAGSRFFFPYSSSTKKEGEAATLCPPPPSPSHTHTCKLLTRRDMHVSDSPAANAKRAQVLSASPPVLSVNSHCKTNEMIVTCLNGAAFVPFSLPSRTRFHASRIFCPPLSPRLWWRGEGRRGGEGFVCACVCVRGETTARPLR